MMRLTAFPVDSFAEDDAMETQNLEGIWRDLTGFEPDTTTRKRLERVRVDDGEYEGAGLQLSVDPFRIQWMRYAKLDIPEMSGLPLLPPLVEAANDFSGLMESWLSRSPPLKRLAFGAVLLRQVDDQSLGYAAIDSYLPAVSVDPASRDFSYQINRRRNVAIDGQDFEINRLSKWSVAKWEAKIKLTNQENEAFHDQAGYACRLELDINSVPQPDLTLSPDRLIPLWRELVHLGREIADSGDIK